MLTFCKMDAELKPQVEALLGDFLGADEHYLASSKAYGDCGDEGMASALNLFMDRPELGFVWVGLEDGSAVAVCIVCFGISTSRGSIVARLDDVFVTEAARGRGVGTTLLSSLVSELRTIGLGRIDTSSHFSNDGAKRFYLRNGFRPLDEERLSLVIEA